MNTIRRKFQTYPVALAIALLIATHARAQLCPARETTAGVSGLSEQPASAYSVAKVASDAVPTSRSSTSAALLQMQAAAPAGFSAAMSPDLPAKAFLPQSIDAQSTRVAANRSRDEVVHKLLLASSQAAVAEVNLQPMFGD